MIPSSVSGPPRMGWVPPHPLHGLLPTNPKQCQVLIQSCLVILVVLAMLLYKIPSDQILYYLAYYLQNMIYCMPIYSLHISLLITYLYIHNIPKYNMPQYNLNYCTMYYIHICTNILPIACLYTTYVLVPISPTLHTSYLAYKI